MRSYDPTRVPTVQTHAGRVSASAARRDVKPESRGGPGGRCNSGSSRPKSAVVLPRQQPGALPEHRQQRSTIRDAATPTPPKTFGSQDSRTTPCGGRPTIPPGSRRTRLSKAGTRRGSRKPVQASQHPGESCNRRIPNRCRRSFPASRTPRWQSQGRQLPRRGPLRGTAPDQQCSKRRGLSP